VDAAKLSALISYHVNGLSLYRLRMSPSTQYLEEQTIAALREMLADCTRTYKIVCLCGSSRFLEAFADAYVVESLKGNVVMSIAGNVRVRSDYEEIKPALDATYRPKIMLADEVLVLNVGGYIGESTRAEIEYAHKLGKFVRYLEEVSVSTKEVSK